MRKCFLDLDGVLVDFVRGACETHGFDYDILMARWPANLWDMCEIMGLSNNKFFEPMGEKFWANLKPTEDAHTILSVVEGIFGEENICILSSPTTNPGSLSGKYMWVDKYFPAYSRKLMISPAKEFCAGPDKVLVDDSDKNIRKFEEHGGKGVIVPRHWNSMHMLKDSVKNYLKVHLVGNYELPWGLGTGKIT